MTDKHNEANGHGNTDGTNDNLSWNCGVEGDADASDAVLALRRQQAKNFCALLMLANGMPMIVAGDEFLNTQRGNNNPYNQDNDITWLDWARLEANREVFRFFKLMIAFRKSHACIGRPTFWREDVSWHGPDGPVDLGHESRCLAYALRGASVGDDDLYVMINGHWEDHAFTVAGRTGRPTGGASSTPRGPARKTSLNREMNPLSRLRTIRCSARSVVCTSPPAGAPMTLPEHKTKIVATIGPASESPEMLERLIRAGLNIARLNFSHGDFAGHAERIARIRAAEKATGRRVAIMADLPGPKMRARQDRAGADPVAARRPLHADQRGHRRQPAAGLDELRSAAQGREAGRPALSQRRPGRNWSSSA